MYRDGGGSEQEELVHFCVVPEAEFQHHRESDNPLEVRSQVTGQERFYSVSMGIEVQVRVMVTSALHLSVHTFSYM